MPRLGCRVLNPVFNSMNRLGVSCRPCTYVHVRTRAHTVAWAERFANPESVTHSVTHHPSANFFDGSERAYYYIMVCPRTTCGKVVYVHVLYMYGD